MLFYLILGMNIFSAFRQRHGNGSNNLNYHNGRNNQNQNQHYNLIEQTTTREEINPRRRGRLNGITLLKLICIYFSYSQHR